MEKLPETSKIPKKKSRAQSYVLYGGLGLSLCTEMVVMVSIGWWLGNIADKKWGSQPWGVVVGILVFLVLSTVHILGVLRGIEDKLDR